MNVFALRLSSDLGGRVDNTNALIFALTTGSCWPFEQRIHYPISISSVDFRDKASQQLFVFKYIVLQYTKLSDKRTTNPELVE